MPFGLIDLSSRPALRPSAVMLVEEYLWLPDAWEGDPPDELPKELRDELMEFPGNATPPRGEVVLAAADGLVGIGILRPVDDVSAEMKHLYVLPRARGAGVGLAVVEHLAALARTLGYSRIVLDVMASRTAAVRLYEAAGFLTTEPYRSYDFFKVELVTYALDL